MSQLRYHPEILLFSFLEASWSHHSNPISRFQDVLDHFSKELTDFHHSLGTAQNAQTATTVAPTPNNIAHFIPFGHADALVICEIDDIEVANLVVERYSEPLEEISLALCPNQDPFSRHWQEATQCAQDPFTRPRDLLSSQEPWLLFTKLRITPLLSLGRALKAQSLVFHSLARQMGAVWKQLSDSWTADHPSVKRLIPDQQSFSQLKIAFVDLQEEEEMGILIRCNNLSLATSLLTAAQNLTFSHLQSIDAAAYDEITNCRTTQRLLDFAQRANTSILHNHVFRWSRGVSAITWDHFLSGYKAFHPSQPDLSPPNPSEGYLNFHTGVSFLPGHYANAEALLPDWVTGVAQKDYLLHSLGTENMPLFSTQQTASAPPQNGHEHILPARCLLQACWTLLKKIEASSQNDEFRHITGWSSKISVPVPRLIAKEGEQDPLHPPVVFKQHNAIIHQLLAKLKSLSRFTPTKWRDNTRKVVGMATTLRRSILHLAGNFGAVLSSHHTFDIVLDYLEVMLTLEQILMQGLPDKIATRSHPSSYVKRLDFEESKAIAELLEAIRDGLEFRLRHIFPESSLRDLSLDLRTSVLQPVLAAESVLKSALAILRKDLLGFDREKNTPAHAYAGRRCIGAILKLGFRPGIELQELKPLHSKCPSSQGPDFRTRLAIFHADFPRLMHVPSYHIFYHEAFHLVFGELQSPGPERPHGFPLIESMDDAPPMLAIQIEETFVQLCVLLFNFRGDFTVMLRDYAVGISTAPQVLHAIGNQNDPNAVLRARIQFIDNLFPTLLAGWVYHTVKEQITPDPALEPHAETVACHPLTFGIEVKLDKIVNWMRQQLVEVEPWFADWQWLFPATDTDALPHMDCRFARWFAQVAECDNQGERLQKIWSGARLLYVRHCQRIHAEHHSPTQPPPPVHSFDDLIKYSNKTADFWPQRHREACETWLDEVDQKILDAWAKSFTSTHDDNKLYTPLAGTDFSLSSGEALSPNLLVRRTIFYYIKLMRDVGEQWGDQENKIATRYLPRNPIPISSPGNREGGWHFPSSEAPYAPLLIDRITPVPFSCQKNVRNWNMGCQIAVQKTLWDVASRSRARRVLVLLDLIQMDAEQKILQP